MQQIQIRDNGSSDFGLKSTEYTMPEEKLARLLSRFATAAVAHNAALEAMDEERVNTHARMIAALHGALLGVGQPGMDGLLTLVDSKVPVVAGMAAVYAIHLSPERCLATLRRVAAEPGLLGFRARAAIERWEAGEWQPPGE